MESWLTDSKLYGESASPDCPEDKSFCYKGRKTGIIVNANNIGNGLSMHPTMPSALELWAGQLKQGPWGGLGFFKNLEFINFKPESENGGKIVAIKMQDKASDYIPM